ncbi:MAG: hypothetical protein RLZZ245_3339 [Verrucomicrobiota bacterium]
MKWSSLCAFFGLAACANRSRPTPLPDTIQARRALLDRMTNTAEPAVLFVGNSYSFGLPSALSNIAATRGKKLRVGHSTYGGWTLERHASHAPTLRKIRDGRWDVVVIQEQSQLPAMSSKAYTTKMFPPVKQLAAEAQANGAIPVLYQTWGRRDGDKTSRGDDFQAMNLRLRNGYTAAAKHAGGIVIVPVGDAWENEVMAGRGSSLFLDDGSHPSQAGIRLNAEIFYQTFFGTPSGDFAHSNGTNDQATR